MWLEEERLGLNPVPGHLQGKSTENRIHQINEDRNVAYSFSRKYYKYHRRRFLFLEDIGQRACKLDEYRRIPHHIGHSSVWPEI